MDVESDDHSVCRNVECAEAEAQGRTSLVSSMSLAAPSFCV